MLFPLVLGGAALVALYKWWDSSHQSSAPKMIGADLDGPAFEGYAPGCTGRPKTKLVSVGKYTFRVSVYRCVGTEYAYYGVAQLNGSSDWVSFVGYRDGHRVFWRSNVNDRRRLNALCIALGVEQ